MPIDLSRKREPDNVLIDRMANQLVTIRAVKHTVTVREMQQRGWTRGDIARLRDRAIRRADAIMAERAGQAA